MNDTYGSNETYVPPKHITDQFKITRTSLTRWSNADKIRFLTTPGGRRLYHLGDVRSLLSGKEYVESDKRRDICYARVSSSHQRGDLERQIGYFKENFPGKEILSDTGSGLNWKRKSLLYILDQVSRGHISTVTITYKDRLCRIGFEIIEWIFKRFGAEIVVLNKEDNTESDELKDDLIAIITFFVARNNGKRSASNRRKRLELQNKENKNEVNNESEENNE